MLRHSLDRRYSLCIFDAGQVRRGGGGGGGVPLGPGDLRRPRAQRQDQGPLPVVQNASAHRWKNKRELFFQGKYINTLNTIFLRTDPRKR